VKEPFERHLRDLVLREDGLREGGAEGGAAGPGGGGQAAGQAGGGRGRGSSPDASGQIGHSFSQCCGSSSRGSGSLILLLRIRILAIYQRFLEISDKIVQHFIIIDDFSPV
jgi:hypothetical protein